MASIDFNGGHEWTIRDLIVSDVRYFHRQCRKCRRDLAMTVEENCWHAVHVGLLQFDYLNEETTTRWIAEQCPGYPLPDEANEIRLRWMPVH
jgi:hypothetical protein